MFRTRPDQHCPQDLTSWSLTPLPRLIAADHPQNAELLRVEGTGIPAQIWRLQTETFTLIQVPIENEMRQLSTDLTAVMCIPHRWRMHCHFGEWIITETSSETLQTNKHSLTIYRDECVQKRAHTHTHTKRHRKLAQNFQLTQLHKKQYIVKKTTVSIKFTEVIILNIQIR